MERRELLKMIAILTGGAVIGGSAFLAGCNPEKGTVKRSISFSKAEIEFLDEVADTILPATKTPGAKAARVGDFMSIMVNDCYEEKDQKIFYEGIQKINLEAKKAFGKEFLSITPAQRLELLTRLDQNKDLNPHFRMMKQLTLLGYFSSEQGCKEAMRYNPVPGRYEGTVPYKKGDRAWA